ncbi:MAG: GNAT family N-acetyltransferase [Oscillospiraceae bacterium]|jgi:predicted N-acetyltransferase YhbS|nr:GNAT family N-acetyltransferase [Oscillospiraceae bacterium]
MQNAEIRIRPERPEDYRAVEELTREAFWVHMNPFYCDEHLLAHRLRGAACFVPELDFVAELDGQLAGNIMFSRARVVAPDGAAHEVLTFGPLSVHPDFQRRGVGGALLRHAVDEARRLGHRAIVFYGNPDYYPRHGFVRAREVGLPGIDPLMAMALAPGAFGAMAGGRFEEDPVFHIKKKDARAFERGFPPKKRDKPAGRGALRRRLPAPAYRAVKSLKVKYLSQLRRYSQDELAALPGMGEASAGAVRAALREHNILWGKPQA